MRETQFIKENVARWIHYKNTQPLSTDEKVERFIETMDDLAYAKTYYPRGKVTNLLNAIAVKTYHKIYNIKPNSFQEVVNFVKYKIPLAAYRQRIPLLISFILFTSFIVIGFFASQKDAHLLQAILSEDYVAKTQENIESGNPFGIYGNENQIIMFIEIALNNIRVAFLAFIGGFIVGIPTINLLINNGTMVGVFFQMFFAQKLGLAAVLIICVHGIIELASIVIAGAAGFTVARSMLFPGTYTRMQSFRKQFKDAVYLIVSLIPFFVIAAFLESFITRMSANAFATAAKGGSLPIPVTISILVVSIVLMYFYFVYWPQKVNKKLGTTHIENNF